MCVDPRPTLVTRRAAVHLAPRAGTNVALLNSLLHEIIRTGRIDRDFVEAHTVGFEELVEHVADTTPAWAARICDVPARKIGEAAEILGGAERLLSTVLQGVYQSHQATAAACQVNNLQLIRGMLGRHVQERQRSHAGRIEFQARAAVRTHQGERSGPWRVDQAGQGDRRADGEQGAGEVGRVEVRQQVLHRDPKSAFQRGGQRSHSGSEGPTKDQLYEEAKKRNIHGRSQMTKRQLENALGR